MVSNQVGGALLLHPRVQSALSVERLFLLQEPPSLFGVGFARRGLKTAVHPAGGSAEKNIQQKEVSIR
jgi:hypothetical protein